MKNDGNSIISTYLTIGEPLSINLNTEMVTSLGNNYTYFKFETDNTVHQRYAITVKNENNYEVQFKTIKASDMNSITMPANFSYGYSLIGLEANKTYFIGIKTSSDENSTIKIQKTETAYQWEYNGVKTSANQLELLRGNQYSIKLWINNQISTTDIFMLNQATFDSDAYNMSFNTITSILTIDANCQIGGNGVFIKSICLQNPDTSYIHTLNIIPEFENSIEIQSINNEDLGFNYKTSKYIQSFIYILTIGTTNNTFNVNITDYNNFNYIYHSIMQNYQSLNYNVEGIINIKIIQITVLTAFNTNKVYTCNILTNSIHNYYKGGTGTTNDPFTISSYRHLNNIRKVADGVNINKSFKLLNSIYVHTNTNWIPLQQFNGVFDGNGYSINDLKITINSYTSELYFGLFKINTGTIKNLSLYHAEFYFYSQAGTGESFQIGFITGINNSGTITNCNILGSFFQFSYIVSETSSHLGSICGSNYGLISYCSVFEVGLEVGFGYIGGIVGANYNTITNSEIGLSHISINSRASAGGITGYTNLYSTIKYCTVNSDVDIRYGGASKDLRDFAPEIGIIIGKCYSTANVQYNTANGTVDSGNLRIITWTEGWWIFAKTYTWDQTQYVKNEIVGRYI